MSPSRRATAPDARAVSPGPPEPTLAQFAIREDLGDPGAHRPGEALEFRRTMELVGTSSLHVAPVGDATEMRLTSNWPHPAFAPAWSPDERSVHAGGFSALWRTTDVATGGQPAWQRAASAGAAAAAASAAGVELVEPANAYAMSYRATEYGFLFVLFTFAALALAETLTGIRLHPIQYALVGSALAVFFLLLLAFSEHIPFGPAYAAASTACVALLTYYLRRPLATRSRTAAFFAFFVALHATLYVLIRSEDHALLMGALLVFGVLAFAMIATRNVDWSRLGASRMPPEAQRPTA